MARLIAAVLMGCFVIYLAFLLVSIVLAIMGQVVFLAAAIVIGILIGIPLGLWLKADDPAKDKDPSE